MADNATSPGEVTPRVDYLEIEESPEFVKLKKTQRGWVFPVLAVSIVWYIIYVCLAGWAKGFMSTPVFGNVNWGIILGLAQVATTWIVTILYVNFANKKLDPLSESIREEIEAEEAPHAA
jgi:uncharacterized membrane protein (DUF485 family)